MNLSTYLLFFITPNISKSSDFFPKTYTTSEYATNNSANDSCLSFCHLVSLHFLLTDPEAVWCPLFNLSPFAGGPWYRGRCGCCGRSGGVGGLRSGHVDWKRDGNWLILYSFSGDQTGEKTFWKNLLDSWSKFFRGFLWSVASIFSLLWDWSSELEMPGWDWGSGPGYWLGEIGAQSQWGMAEIGAQASKVWMRLELRASNAWVRLELRARIGYWKWD
jgi:hypothetical protein